MSPSSPARPYRVSARLSGVTYELVQAVAADFGVTSSRAIELMLQRHVPIAHHERDHAALLQELRADLNTMFEAYNSSALQLQRIGNNANQIARYVNANAAVPMEISDQLDEVYVVLDEIGDTLRRSLHRVRQGARI